MSARSLPSVEKNLFFVGLTLICVGVICNEWLLTKLLSPDGVVEIQNRVAVWLFDIVCIFLGLSIVKISKLLPSRDVFRHLSQSYPRTLSCSIGLILTVIMIVCLEGIFYELNHQKEKMIREENSWIQLPSSAEKGGVKAHPSRRVYGQAIPDPFLGYTLPDNALISDKAELGGQLLYQATYTTDAAHRRVTPIDHPEQRHNFLLFFGCSMTFGLGVYDDETMPFYVAQYALHYKPYNYGVAGYGPNHTLAQFQRGNLTKEIHEQHGMAVYTFIDDHINRVLGAMRAYTQSGVHVPIYTLDVQDRLVKQEGATFGRRLVSLLFWGLGNSQILSYYHITFPPIPRIGEEHIRLTARILEEARKAFHQQFSSDEFYVLLYPGVRRGKELIPYLAQAGIKYLDYSNFMDWPHPGLTLPDERHPTAYGHRLVAVQLAKDLGILDRAEAW
jgi:hypothetical protein